MAVYILAFKKYTIDHLNMRPSMDSAKFLDELEQEIWWEHVCIHDHIIGHGVLK